MDNLETLLDCIAGAIVAGNISGRWRLNLPRVAVVAELVGVVPADLDEGGAHFGAISERIVALSITTPTEADADRTASELFGPNGTLAPGFLEHS
jgi:hypothetical protein